MNTRTKRLEPRLRLLISGRFFPTETRSLQRLGWPAHIATVADQAAPHAEAKWLPSLETAALHADAIVCLLVDDALHSPPSKSAATPDWPSRVLDTVSDWRRQWHPEPLVVRCLSLASLAHAGALAQLLLARDGGIDATSWAEPLDTRLHHALQSSTPDGQWHLHHPLPWWQHHEPSAGTRRVRRGLGLSGLANSLLKPMITRTDRTLFVCGQGGELWVSNHQLPGEQRTELKAWLAQQRVPESGLRGSSCVTSDPRPGR